MDLLFPSNFIETLDLIIGFDAQLYTSLYLFNGVLLPVKKIMCAVNFV